MAGIKRQLRFRVLFAQYYYDIDVNMQTSRLSIASDVSRSSRASITLMNSILMDGPSGNSSCGSTSMKVTSCAINTDGALVFASLTSHQHQAFVPELQKSHASSSFELLNDSGGDMGAWDGDGDYEDDDYCVAPDGGRTNEVFASGKESMGVTDGSSHGNHARNASVEPPARNPLAILDPYDTSPGEQSRHVRPNKRSFKSSVSVLQKNSRQSRKDNLLSKYAESTKQQWGCCIDVCELLQVSSPRRSKSFLGPSSQFSDILKRRKRHGYYRQYATGRVSDLERAPRVGVDDEWVPGVWGDADFGDDANDDASEGFHDEGGFDDASVDIASEGSKEELSDEQLLSRRVEGVLHEAGLSMAGDLSLGLMSESGLNYSNTFENLCRQHIKNFMRGAETYARETNLSKRVSEWTSRLEPILLDQEQRPEFDIHTYSDRALEKVAHRSKEINLEGISEQERLNPTPVHFSDVVRGESSFEVGRIFLACLQLANLGNLTFSQIRGSISDFDVGLLKESSNRLQIDSYRAPSVNH